MTKFQRVVVALCLEVVIMLAVIMLTVVRTNRILITFQKDLARGDYVLNIIDDEYANEETSETSDNTQEEEGR